MTGLQAHKRLFALLLAAALTVPLALASGCGVLGSDLSAEDGTTVEGSGSPSSGSAYSLTVPQDAAVAPDAVTQRNVTASGEDASTVPADQRLVIRAVDMRVEVDDVEESVAALRKAVETRKGIVTDLQVSTDEDVPIYRPYVEGSALSDGAALSGYMTVRVPSESLESFIAEASKLGKVLRQSENEKDVTQQHVDLTARLTNLKATEAQLRTFMNDAKNVTEMLAVQEQLTTVRGEIEAMQAEIAYLERQAAMSTVTVELLGPTPVVRPQGEDWGFVNALTQSVRSFVNTVNVLIVVLGALAPIILIAAAAFFAIRWFVRRRRAAAETPVETATEEASEPESDGTEQ